MRGSAGNGGRRGDNSAHFVTPHLKHSLYIHTAIICVREIYARFFNIYCIITCIVFVESQRAFNSRKSTRVRKRSRLGAQGVLGREASHVVLGRRTPLQFAFVNSDAVCSSTLKLFQFTTLPKFPTPSADFPTNLATIAGPVQQYTHSLLLRRFKPVFKLPTCIQFQRPPQLPESFFQHAFALSACQPAHTFFQLIAIVFVPWQLIVT